MKLSSKNYEQSLIKPCLKAIFFREVLLRAVILILLLTCFVLSDFFLQSNSEVYGQVYEFLIHYKNEPLVLKAQAVVQAGDSLPLNVSFKGVTTPENTEALLIMSSTYGIRTKSVKISGREAVFQLTGEDTRYSGLMNLVVTAGSTRFEASLNILPGPPTLPLSPLLGGKEMEADGQTWVTAAALPIDIFGNSANDGFPLLFQTLHPGDKLEEQQAAVNHLLAWVRVKSKTISGPTTVSVKPQDGPAPTTETRIEEVAGLPEGLSVTAVPTTLSTTTRGVFTIRTGVLKDRFDNTIPDGTSLTFKISGPVGPDGSVNTTFVPAFLANGVGLIILPCPTATGIYKVWANLSGIESPATLIKVVKGVKT